jgi:hypothetical protein
LVAPGPYRRLVHPLLVRASRDERYRRALERSEIFFPYFAMAVRYDDRRARVALRSSGIAPTPLRSYFDQLVGFALAAEWGRRDISRVSVSKRDVPIRRTRPGRARSTRTGRRAAPPKRGSPVAL